MKGPWGEVRPPQGLFWILLRSLAAPESYLGSKLSLSAAHSLQGMRRGGLWGLSSGSADGEAVFRAPGSATTRSFSSPFLPAEV